MESFEVSNWTWERNIVGKVKLEEMHTWEVIGFRSKSIFTNLKNCIAKVICKQRLKRSSLWVFSRLSFWVAKPFRVTYETWPFNLNLGLGLHLGFSRSKEWSAGSFPGSYLRKRTSGSGEGKETKTKYINEQAGENPELLGLSPAGDLWKTVQKVSCSFSTGSMRKLR